MGAIADALPRFAQPLIDATDGSPEGLQRALSLSQLCWNLATIPEAKREQVLAEMQPNLYDASAQVTVRHFRLGCHPRLPHKHTSLHAQGFGRLRLDPSARAGPTPATARATVA
jgi:hypothetical protein